MISDIFNRSLQEGVFPDRLKLSYIKPLFKALDRFSFQNYRPITSLNLLSKLLEKLMNCRLSNYLDKHSLISQHQYGFKKGFSTSDALLRFTNEVVNALNDRKYLVAVYLDLSKAFDTVNHKILLSKMERLGIRGLALDWYRSYLKDRTVQVEVDKILSKKMVVNIGVPQGSVTAPTLFLIYINDMCNVSDALDMVQFADDTTLYMVGDNLTELSYRMSGELAKIDRWLVANRLSLNLTKTSYMVFSHNNIPDDPKISVRNVDIGRVHKTSFLGINIDDQLKFSYHVDSVARKLSRSAGAIYRMSSIAPASVLLTLYYSLFYPHVIYGITVWGNSSEGNMNKISRFHNRIMRLFAQITDENSFKLLNIRGVYKYFTLITFYKYVNNKTYPFFSNILSELVPTHSHTTRFASCDFFNTPVYRKSICQKFFFCTREFSFGITCPLNWERSHASPNLKLIWKNFFLIKNALIRSSYSYLLSYYLHNVLIHWYSLGYLLYVDSRMNCSALLHNYCVFNHAIESYAVKVVILSVCSPSLSPADAVCPPCGGRGGGVTGCCQPFCWFTPQCIFVIRFHLL